MTDDHALLCALATPPADTARLVVAFSGGRDSASLLHALASQAGGPTLCAVHVCHHLEAQCEGWAAFCTRQAEALGVPLTRLDVAVDVSQGGLEAAARAARYAAIADWLAPGDVLVCAHHARDQAETVLLQALRGTGMRGLAAMPRLAALGPGRLWRPWRDVSSEAIAAYATRHTLDYIDDPSNTDPRRERGWLDQTIWPALVARRAGVVGALSRVAERAAEATAAIEALAGVDLAASTSADGALSIAALAGLSAPRRAEVLRRWLGDNAADVPDHRQIAALAGLLEAREHNSPRVVFGATEVRRFDGRLFVMRRLAPPPDGVFAWTGPATVALPGDAGCLALDAPVPATAWPDALTVVFRRGGERIVRADGRRIALKDWLREQRIAPWVRERMPLIYVADRLVAVADRWLCADWPACFAGFDVRPRWRHELVGDPGCVVASRALG
ncbi:tRNA lysidine(34) synthetase TilS [Salinisphaera sp. Q1T1-3]|uniref:tRNA lysidine(34) synthetase TilS n=1 Tax=Salinisphaera sp. Q1T1-3 TaxID=2321229 RepID=UPI000E76DCBA|nr:tRNA lysidine(34) synthetase TilS [Salinisphaera sp. Q1T1-3]RJS95326.1 tRNA lysidine(34) synthetase TilS [Salinisphaera sp. Q1T1-3]